MIGKTSRIQNRSKLIFQKHWAWSRTTNEDQIVLLKKGIWIYFFLLIFEGALRKWFLPFLATPLLIVRDPIALLLLFRSWQYRLLPPNFYVFTFQAIGILGIYTAFFFGHGNPWVAVFGARIFLIHFPMIFVMGQIFNREDVVQTGRMILMISIPMTFLIALQYYSPQSAWVNRGVAGDMNGAGFSGIGSFYRPPATFSFTNGTTLFYDLVGCYVLYFWFHQKEIKKWVLICSTLSLVAAVPLSLSRGLSLQIGLSFLFVIIAISRKPQYAGKIIAAIISAIVIISVFSKLSFFETSLANLSGRFELASNAEGNWENILNNRFIGGLIGSLKNPSECLFLDMGWEWGQMPVGLF